MDLNKSGMLVFDADKDNGGAVGTVTPTGGESGAATPASGQNGGDAKPFKSFASEDEFQKTIDDMLKDRLERERKKSETAAETARKKAEEAAAAKNGEWQKLAEQREQDLAALNAKLSEVEPLRGMAEKYETALRAQLETAKKALPAHILPLLEKLPVDEQLAYIAANAVSFNKPGGPPATPAPADPSEAEKARREQARPQFERTVKSWF